MRLVAPQALAIRRAALAASCFAATLAAHLVADPEAASLGPAVPIVVATMVLAAMLLGPRRAPFRPRGPLRLLASLVMGQGVAHLAMAAAPWAFGLVAHHQAPLVTPASAATHLVAALILAGMLAWGERLLVVALAAVAAVRRLVAPSRRRGPVPSLVRTDPWRTANPPSRRPARPRGPPTVVVIS